MDPESDMVCGVERELIERYLLLIKDNYRKAEKATYFLEHKTGIVNLAGVTNVRDALSHLVTLLDDATPSHQREAQLVSAEEHLRRAILEPYNIAVNRKIVTFEKLYENYRRRLLPVQSQHPSLLGAPNDVVIRSTLKEIHVLVSKGRAAKAKNLWDPGWEEGVAALIEAFDKTSELYATVEGYWFKYEVIEQERGRLQSEKKHIWLAAWGITATIATFAIGTVLVLEPSLVTQIRRFLHLP